MSIKAYKKIVVDNLGNEKETYCIDLIVYCKKYSCLAESENFEEAKILAMSNMRKLEESITKGKLKLEYKKWNF